MTSVRLQQTADAARDRTSCEVIQQPCESGEPCLELWKDGCRVESLYLSDEMMELFINLEASYRQQGMTDSAVRAFQQLSDIEGSGR
ncbi:hypothetical protein M1D97_08180 [Kushneria sp. AK178]